MDDKSLNVAIKRMTDHPTYGNDRNVVIYSFYIQIVKIGNPKEKLNRSTSTSYANRKTPHVKNPLTSIDSSAH